MAPGVFFAAFGTILIGPPVRLPWGRLTTRLGERKISIIRFKT